MKLLIFTPEIHFQSPLVLRELFRKFSGGAIEFHVVVTPKISSGKKSPASLKRIVKDTGVLYFASMALLKLKFDLYRALEKLCGRDRDRRMFMSPPEVCAAYGVECVRFRSVNSPECLAHARAIAPDIILCVFFNQILKADMLACAGRAALNLHPSPLPEYRGMSPVLWMLAEGAEEGGATVHHMNDKIDEGNIVVCKKFRIEDADSFFRVYCKAAEAGAAMLGEVLDLPEIPRGEAQPAGMKAYGPLTKDAFAKVFWSRSVLGF